MDELVDKAVDEVEAHCTPDKMSKQQAMDFLEDVIARLESSVEALREEIDNDGGG